MGPNILGKSEVCLVFCFAAFASPGLCDLLWRVMLFSRSWGMSCPHHKTYQRFSPNLLSSLSGTRAGQGGTLFAADPKQDRTSTRRSVCVHDVSFRPRTTSLRTAVGRTLRRSSPPTPTTTCPRPSSSCWITGWCCWRCRWATPAN